jgi:TonB family protein
MTRKRPSEPSPDLGSLSAVLAPAADERRGVQVGLAVAVVLHAVFFAVTWPSSASQPPRAEPTIIRVPPNCIYIPPTPPPSPRVPVLEVIEIPVPEHLRPEPGEPPISSAMQLPFDPQVIQGLVPPPPPPESTPPLPQTPRAGIDVQAPRILTKVDPRYTESARVVRKQGAVVLELLIDEQGAVAEITVLRGLPLGLTESAVDAVRQWRFEPSTLGDRPVAVRYTLTVHFRLE